MESKTSVVLKKMNILFGVDEAKDKTAHDVVLSFLNSKMKQLHHDLQINKKENSAFANKAELIKKSGVAKISGDFSDLGLNVVGKWSVRLDFTRSKRITEPTFIFSALGSAIEPKRRRHEEDVILGSFTADDIIDTKLMTQEITKQLRVFLDKVLI